MKISLKGKDNIYEQIVNEYKRFINLRIIGYNEKLPSCRNLAKELGINPNTVARAYAMLEQDGYIKAFPKKGVYVVYNENGLDTFKMVAKEKLREICDCLTKEEVLHLIDEIYGGTNYD